jgi:hypothetical protein
MSKFNLPKIVRPIDLTAYAPELAEQLADASPPIMMWVNPPISMRESYEALTERSSEALDAFKAFKPSGDKGKDAEQAGGIHAGLTEAADALFAWWAGMWSQGKAPETHWTAEEVRALAHESRETDPAFWPWIQNACFELMAEHLKAARKN